MHFAGIRMIFGCRSSQTAAHINEVFALLVTLCSQIATSSARKHSSQALLAALTLAKSLYAQSRKSCQPKLAMRGRTPCANRPSSQAMLKLVHGI